MSTRPMPPPASSNAESDLDSTAELPVLDPAAVSGAAEQHAGTDTWASPPAARTALSAAADADAVRQLEANLQSVSTALQSVTTQLHEAQELLASRGERLTELERIRDEARAELAAAQRRAANLEQHNAALSAELAQRQDGDAQKATQLEEASRARAAAERRAAAAGAELAAACALASDASERAAELQSRLERYDSESRTQRSYELEQQQALAQQGRAHAAGLMEDLHYERARAMSYLESLQSLESRRSIAESLVTDLQHEAEVRESGLQRLVRELAGHQSRERGLNAELEERAASIARLEQTVGAVSAALAQRDAQLRDARRHSEGLQASVARLRGEITTVGVRHQALEWQLEQKHSAASQQLTELQRLRSERSELSAALESARSAAAAAEATAARAASQGALLAEQREHASQLRAESDAHAARVSELEADTVPRLEADARLRGAHVAIDDAANPARRDAVGHPPDDGVAAEPPLDGATRLLIQSDGGREIVHVLGRKTSIGRTPDNDLQVDAGFVSRHHAVILAGPAHTIIEDLNSTNGVQVNGRRITRTTLRDGDQIAIGRAQYRFAVRDAADKH